MEAQAGALRRLCRKELLKHVLQIFVGDALFPGGNDYPAKETGVVCIQVRDPDEAKRVIEAVIACLDKLPNTCHKEIR